LRPDEDGAVVPTAHHLLVAVDPNEAAPRFQILSYRVGPATVGDIAFVRNGDSLVAESVPSVGAESWRLGAVLADTVGLLDHTTASADLRLTARPFIATDDPVSYACETMLRSALYRLRGVWMARAGVLRAARSCQGTVRRAVSAMERFAGIEGGGAVLLEAWVRDCMAENRAVALRLTDDFELGTPGVPVLFLERLGRTFASSDERMADSLPSPTHAAMLDCPTRRPAAAFFRLALRYEGMLPEDVDEEIGRGLRAVASGLLIHAAALTLRMQSIERVAALGGKQRMALLEAPPPLEDLGIDDTALLVRNGGASQQDLLKALAGTLGEATQTPFCRRYIDEVTPLGWAVLLAWVLGLRDSAHSRGTGAVSRQEPENNGQAGSLTDGIRRLCGLLASVSTGEEFPWEGTCETLHAWSSTECGWVFALLRRVDKTAELEVVLRQDSLFAFKVHDRIGAVDVSTPEGRQTVGRHQFTHSILHGRDMRLESRLGSDGRTSFQWTESTSHGQKLSYSAISEKLAHVAGLQPAGPTHALAGPAHESTAPPLSVPGPSGAGSASPTPEAGSSPVASKCAPCVVVPSPGEPGAGPSSRLARDLCELRRMQGTSWMTRDKEGQHARVALLQMDIDESYSHPVIDICTRSSLVLPGGGGAAVLRRTPGIWDCTLARDNGLKTMSCAEHRRRGILVS